VRKDKGRDRKEETEGKRQRGRYRQEIHRRRDGGKETEGNGHRESYRGEQAREGREKKEGERQEGILRGGV
jgi:hypothetical protein